VCSPQIFEDSFIVKDLDVGGQVFHNVSRLVAKSETNQVDLVMDVQCEMYRLRTKEKFLFTIATTLDLSGKPDPKYWTPNNEPSLLDKNDYCMHGKIYRVDQLPNSRVMIYVSHGGLLMKITADSRNLRALKQDDRIYTLLRKVVVQ
jgi:DNA-directed RNA polymerase I, II, and III subunit RPABC3